MLSPCQYYSKCKPCTQNTSEMPAAAYKKACLSLRRRVQRMKAGALKLIVSAAFSPWNKPTPVRQMTEVKHSSTHGPRNFFMPMIPPALKFRCRAMLSEHARHSHQILFTDFVSLNRPFIRSSFVAEGDLRIAEVAVSSPSPLLTWRQGPPLSAPRSRQCEPAGTRGGV